MSIAVDKASLGTPGFADSSTSLVFTTSQAVAAGGFIVLAIAMWKTGGPPTVDSVAGGGLTWSVDVQGRDAGGPGALGVALVSAQAPSGLASSTAITATLSAIPNGWSFMGGTSFTGVATSSPVDGTPPAIVGTVSPNVAWTTSSNSIQAGSLIVAVTGNETNNSGNTITSPSVEAWEYDGGFSAFSAVEAYRIESSAGSYTVAGTWGIAAGTQTASVAYLAATGGVSAATIQPAGHGTGMGYW